MKKFVSTGLEIFKFDADDVIATSCGGSMDPCTGKDCSCTNGVGWHSVQCHCDDSCGCKTDEY